VTGLDFSPSAIEAATDLARRAGLDRRATFVCANVYDATTSLSPATFDIVYVSLGALCWLPSVERWADQVAALARPGGRLYLHDSHPLAWSLAYETPTLESTYFEEPDPYVDDSEETYTDADQPLVNVRSYEWNHSLGLVVTALVDRGLRLDSLIEHDWTVHQRFPWLIETAAGHWTTPPGRPRLPLSFTVVATRLP
jgi:SAM-dependent methyltransferase